MKTSKSSSKEFIFPIFSDIQNSLTEVYIRSRPVGLVPCTSYSLRTPWRLPRWCRTMRGWQEVHGRWLQWCWSNWRWRASNQRPWHQMFFLKNVIVGGNSWCRGVGHKGVMTNQLSFFGLFCMSIPRSGMEFGGNLQFCWSRELGVTRDLLICWVETLKTPFWPILANQAASLFGVIVPQIFLVLIIASHLQVKAILQKTHSNLQIFKANLRQKKQHPYHTNRVSLGCTEIQGHHFLQFQPQRSGRQKQQLASRLAILQGTLQKSFVPYSGHVKCNDQWLQLGDKKDKNQVQQKTGKFDA